MTLWKNKTDKETKQQTVYQHHARFTEQTQPKGKSRALDQSLKHIKYLQYIRASVVTSSFVPVRQFIRRIHNILCDQRLQRHKIARLNKTKDN